MILDFILCIVGLAVLVYSADKLVEAASNLALNLGVSKMVVGLTIVAAGTSLPEFFVSLTSSIQGNPSLSLGNVVGSNIMNIALILGVTALVLPINSKKEMVKREVPIMIAVTALAWIFAKTDSVFSPVEGAILLIVFVIYNTVSYVIGKNEAKLAKEYAEEADRFVSYVEDKEDDQVKKEDNQEKAESNEGKAEADEKSKEESDDKQLPSVKVNILWLIAGLIGLGIGSKLLVDSATKIAAALGVSSEVIGLTIVAIGTSLPELVTSIVAAKKGQSDLSIGNVLGSNIFNLTAIIGTAATVPWLVPNATGTKTLVVSPEMLSLNIPIMMVVAVILLPIMITDMKISRKEGAFFLAIYICYTIMLVQMNITNKEAKENVTVRGGNIQIEMPASTTSPLNLDAK